MSRRSLYRVLSIIFAIALVLQLYPAGAWAGEDATPNEAPGIADSQEQLDDARDSREEPSATEVADGAQAPDVEPAETEAGETDAVETEAEGTEPTDGTEPAETEPTEAEPTGTIPAETELEGSEDSLTTPTSADTTPEASDQPEPTPEDSEEQAITEPAAGEGATSPQTFTITYDANGGTFPDGSFQKTVEYAATYGTITKYSHTDNIADDGTQSGAYANLLATKDVVRIPGAGALHVSLRYGTETNDKLYVFQGEYRNLVWHNIDAGQLYTLQGGEDTVQTMEFDVEGDTVTFAFYSDSRQCYYGYHATVTGVGCTTVPTAGAYLVPSADGVSAKSWRTKPDGSGQEVDPAYVTGSAMLYACYVDWEQCGSCQWAIESDGTLVVRPLDGSEGTLPDWDSYKLGYNGRTPWDERRNEIVSNRFEGTIHAQTCHSMFAGCGSLESVDLTGLDTSAVKRMDGMFDSCRSLVALDLSGLETSSVTDMGNLLSYCTSLTTLNLSGLDTSSVTDMSSMFDKCLSLTVLDLSGFDTSSLTIDWDMFHRCLANRIDVGPLCHLQTFPGLVIYDHEMDDPIKDNTTWLSMRDGTWYTSREIAQSRAGVEDTYTTGQVVLDGYKPVAMKLAEVTVADQTYAKAALKPAPHVTMAGQTLRAGTDYVLSYENNVDVGTATVTLTGKGDFAGKIDKTFKIGPASLAKAKVTLATTSYPYDGKAKKPGVASVTLTLGGRSVTLKSSDYTVAYKNNVNAGTATVTVTGRGNFVDTAKASFTIKRASIAKGTVAALGSKTYTGKALVPTLKLTLGGKTLKAGTDYTVSYKNAKGTTVAAKDLKAAGSYTVVLAGKGNYAGTAKASYKIVPASLAKAKVAAIPNQYATGKALRPAPKVTFGGKVLKAGTDYTVSYANNTKAGTATVTAKGKGNYTGTIKATFRIIDRWERLAGTNAVGTMKVILNTDGVFTPSKVKTVVVAGRRDFKMALAGVALAGLADGPLLITEPGSLSGATKSELQRLKPDYVYVCGGNDIVSKEAFNQIRVTVPKASVIRTGDEASAGEAANSIYWSGAIDYSYGNFAHTWSDTAVLTTQASFKDALSIAPYAYAKHIPVYYTESTRMGDGKGMSQGTESALTKFNKIVVVGGPAAVPESVVSVLRSKGKQVERIAGANAIETSKLIAQYGLAHGMNRKHLAVATTQDFADALAGAALAGAQGSVLVLANQTGGYAAFDALVSSKDLVHGHVLGGPFALSEASEAYFRKR